MNLPFNLSRLASLLTALSTGVVTINTAPAVNDNSAAIPSTAWVGAQITACVGDSRNLTATLTSAGTSLTYTADNVIVKTSLGGITYCIANLNATIVSTAAGAGGISSSSTMPASGYLAIYAIYNPTTQASTVVGVNATSTIAPEICAATMPAGYTASALIGVWPTNSSSQFSPGYQTGRALNIPQLTALSASSSSGSYVAVSIAGAVPMNAKSCYGYGQAGLTTAALVQWAVAASSTGIGWQSSENGTANTSGGGNFHVPILTAQTVYWWATSSNLSYFYLTISGYSF